MLSGVLDLNVHGYVNWAVTDLLTSSIGVFPGYDYNASSTYPTACTAPITATCIALGATVPPYYGDLQVSFQDPLDGTMWHVPIAGGSNGPSWESTAWGATTRYIVDGTATLVPEPSTWAMMGLGFAALGFAAFRGNRRARALA